MRKKLTFCTILGKKGPTQIIPKFREKWPTQRSKKMVLTAKKTKSDPEIGFFVVFWPTDFALQISQKSLVFEFLAKNW